MPDHPYREFVLFSVARGLLPSQRAAYLDQACLGNVALRQRVQELLQADEQAGNFLREPAPGACLSRIRRMIERQYEARVADAVPGPLQAGGN